MSNPPQPTPPADRVQALLTRRYDRLAASDDAAVQRLAAIQRARLAAVPPGQTRAAEHTAPPRPSIPVADLFARAGNKLHERRAGFETGHEPVHGSRSGRCVWINPAAGRWSCRSCGAGGDAVAAVMSLRGLGARQARVWLAKRYPSAARATGVRPC